MGTALEDLFAAKLKMCREILRANGLGHLYPDANPEAEKIKAPGYSPELTKQERLALLNEQYQCRRYKMLADHWEAEARRLHLEASQNGVELFLDLMTIPDNAATVLFASELSKEGLGENVKMIADESNVA